MEHTFAVTFAALLLVAAAVLSLFALTGFFENNEETLAAESGVSVSEKSEPQKMVLGVFEGKLALFIGESPYPNIVYDFLTRTLPPEDQNRLSEGIEVSDEKELESLLEDFMS